MNYKVIVQFISIVLVISTMQLNAQIKIDVKKKLEKETNKRLNKKTDQVIDKTFDKMEKDVDETVSKKKTDPSQNDNPEVSETKETTNEKKTDIQSKGSKNEVVPAEKPQEDKPQLQWTRFDFVPGTEIIFEDNLEGEKNGEFPSKWDLTKGSVENAIFDNQNVIYFIKCNINSGGNIVPLLKNNTEDYLPEEFTVEFDAWFGEHSSSYLVNFADIKNQFKLDNTMRADEKWLRFNKNGGEHNKDIETKYYPGFSSGQHDKTSKWRHISISFNTRALKAYLDDARIINIPNLGYNPTGITLGYHNPGSTTVGYIKNIRIAKGAVPLYDKVLTDGKFITTGIKFDVNKATIKPESMGTISFVVKMMTDHPELKFSVEGHTDSDGIESTNLTLSEARANAVRKELISMGISSDRLTSKGHGESKPMTGNDTPEGKAQNRRVEFVKF